jgi:hypothetical protein
MIVSEGDTDEATTNEYKAAAKSPTSAAWASTKTSTKAIKIAPLLIHLPFLASAALKSISHNPIDLILAIKTATKDFNESLNGTSPRNATEPPPPSVMPKTAPNSSYNGCMPSTCNLLTKIKFSFEPDNEEIQVYAEDCHQNCILPPLKQNIPPHQGFEANKSIIQQLIQATNRNNKVCKETNKMNKIGKRSPTR